MNHARDVAVPAVRTGGACRAGHAIAPACWNSKRHVFRSHWRIWWTLCPAILHPATTSPWMWRRRANTIVQQGRRGSRFPPICAAIARQPRRRRRVRAIARAAGLPVPRLGLQSRRHPARAARPAFVRSRQDLEFGLVPLDLENPGLIHPLQGPRQLGGELLYDRRRRCRITDWRR